MNVIFKNRDGSLKAGSPNMAVPFHRAKWEDTETAGSRSAMEPVCQIDPHLVLPEGPKRKLLYASPFPPQKSGISDYSEVLVYGLREYFDVTLLIDDYQLQNQQLYKDFRVKVYGKDPLTFNLFDYHVYNIGNNPHVHGYIYEVALRKPGLIILHDVILYYLTVGFHQEKGALYSKIYEMADAWGVHLIRRHVKAGQDLLKQKYLARSLPLNLDLLHSPNKIMVHSDYAYREVSRAIGPGQEQRLRKINHVNLIRDGEKIIQKSELFKKFQIPEDVVTICSFGNIDCTKLNHIVCQSIRRLNGNNHKEVMYVMVGEGDYADEFLGPHIRKTGYVPLVEFNSFIQHADIVVNLRHPSMGETSGAVLRALGLGKPCVVSDDAWFSELSDDIVLKVGNGNIEESLCSKLSALLSDSSLKQQVSRKAKEYADWECGIKRIAAEMFDFMKET